MNKNEDHFSTILTRSDIPKFASNNRVKPTQGSREHVRVGLLRDSLLERDPSP
jgi:hypothetical protein